MNALNQQNGTHGEFIDFMDDRYYVIRNVDQMKPFFISVVSNVDHWLFVSSSGGLTAGRVSPKTALFPYVTVDKIHESTHHTGSKTIIRVEGDAPTLWEPFNREHDGIYAVSRNIYKNTLGNKLCFEEINHSLNLTFRYSWSTSDRYGFVRQCELSNNGNRETNLSFVDGLQNMLPAGTPAFAQTNTSNLVDAYKWTEIDEPTGLAYLTLYSGITDRAEPSESLKATTAFCLGLNNPKVLISAKQLRAFRSGGDVEVETHTRGMRGAYFVNQKLTLPAGSSQDWRIVADIEKSQSAVVALRRELDDTSALNAAISKSITNGSEDLARIMAIGDGFQATAEENVSVHHYANVLFNTMRGGIFYDQYRIPMQDFANNIEHFNREVHERHQSLFSALPEHPELNELLAAVSKADDPQLERLTYEYLPITFGRRHGDPSRPWNQFAIKVKDDQGNSVLSYEGNWRDIFQNWEALLLSFPDFAENIIAKFVNASTIDGYNPYRITKEGIDWEVEEPEDPWSYIGYWGDHQIIYLQKLLELSNDFHPNKLSELLRKRLFSYANVPYQIASFEEILANPKSTVAFKEDLAAVIEQRVESIGADGKLLLDQSGSVYMVNLLEKLLVPLLSKLGNLVIDGGIWLTTQRPEWNDANNALVGHGLSMVTLCYMHRYVTFLSKLLANESGSFELSKEVDEWLVNTASSLADVQPLLHKGPVSAQDRHAALASLGQAASQYRQKIYEQQSFSGTASRSGSDIVAMLDDALSIIDHSIATNLRQDGLYHAYNLIGTGENAVTVDTLYPMLEGQVAALSAGSLAPEAVLTVLEELFSSDIYRANQDSFMLYPDRALPGFLNKNILDEKQCGSISLLSTMLASGDTRIVELDADGNIRFNADFANGGDLNARLDALAAEGDSKVEQSREAVLALFESVFNHKAFTGRSGTMFGFEGLGSIYWHM
ncbi:MAG: hypothetical protein AB8G18_18170, partial [Gammaproteobacteria bacterium]